MSAFTIERSDKDYAIEHGRYLATNAERFLEAYDALNDLDDVDESARQAAEEKLADHYKGLRSGIYEFRKRADRAYPVSATQEKP